MFGFWIDATIAILGAAASCVAIVQVFGSRVRLTVDAGFGRVAPSGAKLLVVTVRNLSSFAITLESAYVVGAAETTFATLLYRSDAGQFPIRMQARSSATFYFPRQYCRDILASGHVPVGVKAVTQCGHARVGAGDKILLLLEQIAR